MLYAAIAAAPRVGILQAVGTVLLGAIPWALPGTPDRGAATALLLATLLGIAVTQATSEPARARAARSIVATILGAQLLARGGELLDPSPLDVVAIVGWSTVAAAATLFLRERRGTRAAVLAAAVAFVLGQGFSATSALALVVPAAAVLAFDRERSLLARAAATFAMLAPLLWHVERGALLAACGIALAGPPWARATASLAGLAAFFAPGGADRSAGLIGPLWLLALLPIVASELRLDRLTRWSVLALAMAAAAQTTDRVALAAPAAILALTVAGESATWMRLQWAWSGLVAGAVAVFAAYPWLRADALSDATAVLGLGGGGRAPLLVAGIVIAVALVSALFARGARGGDVAPRALVLVLAACALLAHPATTAIPLARQPIQLDARAPSWTARLARPARAGGIVLDSALSNAAAVPTGAVVAEVRLHAAGTERVLPLRAGIDTGEWAARRADVHAVDGFAAPPAYLHWVDAGGEFFGQRYRARWRLDDGPVVDAIEVHLADSAPRDLVLTLFDLEVAR